MHQLTCALSSAHLVAELALSTSSSVKQLSWKLYETHSLGRGKSERDKLASENLLSQTGGSGLPDPKGWSVIEC